MEFHYVYNCKYAIDYLCHVKEKLPLERMLDWHSKNHQEQLFGRYITASMIAPILKKIKAIYSVKELGFSVQKRSIHSIEIGQGDTRILMWSQMHGNESTTTKALFDMLKAFTDPALSNELDEVLKKFTICIIPILNPDGAHHYTRNNAQDIDLNRDAQTLSQPESIILRKLFNDFQPDICFNLHGQRTIYGFEATGSPSVLSFLSPSADEERSVTLSRKRSMSIITNIYKDLAVLLPQQIGRYDDGFNINCVGDTFQNSGVPTVLFEAGHAPGDYNREVCRSYIFLALLSALKSLTSSHQWKTRDYLRIPEHQKCYCDLLIKNTAEGDIRIQYHERLEEGKIVFKPRLADRQETKAIFGHRTIDAKGAKANIIFDIKQDIFSDINNIILDNGLTITL